MRQVVVELAGVPVGKGRPRFIRKTGHAYTPQKTLNYEGALRVGATEAMAGKPPIEGPVMVEVVASFPVPPSWSKKKKALALAGAVRPGRPDIDNQLKALDAFNEIVWHDDAQIAEARLSKVYGETSFYRVIVTALVVLEREDEERQDQPSFRLQPWLPERRP